MECNLILCFVLPLLSSPHGCEKGKSNARPVHSGRVFLIGSECVFNEEKHGKKSNLYQVERVCKGVFDVLV